jgi:NADH-quinone oxidoreductase subunit J
MLEPIAFYTLAALIIGFGVLVVTTSNPVHCGLFLAATFVCVAGIYVLVAAEFLATIQILVYTGGIAVLYLFVVILVHRGHQPEAPMDRRRHARLGLVVGALLLAEISPVLMSSAGHRPDAVAAAPQFDRGGNTEAVGMLLYTDYLVPLEIASLLLLAAMVGALVLARKEA